MEVVRSIVGQVQQQLTQQRHVIETQVQTYFRRCLQSVLRGVWTGRGADAFVASMEQEGMQMSENILSGITSMNSSITRAVETVDQGERVSRSAVDNLFSTFDAL